MEEGDSHCCPSTLGRSSSEPDRERRRRAWSPSPGRGEARTCPTYFPPTPPTRFHLPRPHPTPPLPQITGRQEIGATSGFSSAAEAGGELAGDRTGSDRRRRRRSSPGIGSDRRRRRWEGLLGRKWESGGDQRDRVLFILFYFIL